ncbi:MAG: glycoside hydrolase family 2 protein, partial [Jatrophihabitans sp.]
CWPVTSWAAIDGDGRRKPLWYSMRRSYRDRLLIIQPRDGGLALVVVNDSSARWTANVEVNRNDVDGSVLAKSALELDIMPRGAVTLRLPDDVATAQDSTREVVLAETGGDRAWWHFAEDVDAALPAPELDTRVDAVDGGYEVTVQAGTFVRDLGLLADRMAADAVVDEMLVTLLPGESVVFRVSTAEHIDPAALVDPLVLRSANQLLDPR